MRHIQLLQLALESLHTGGFKEQTCKQIEDYLSTLHTHGYGCWSWGPSHYMCALDEIDRLKRLGEPDAR